MQQLLQQCVENSTCCVAVATCCHDYEELTRLHLAGHHVAKVAEVPPVVSPICCQMVKSMIVPFLREQQHYRYSTHAVRVLQQWQQQVRRTVLNNAIISIPNSTPSSDTSG